MALNRPTLQQIIDRIAADMKASISGAVTIALRSVLQVLARVWGGAIHLLYGYADNITEQLFASTADGEYLDKLGAEIGLPRKAAAFATGTITISGTVGTVIPADTEFTSLDGYIYLLDDETTIGGGGTVSADITAQFGGTDYNDNAGAELSFVSPVAGVSSTVTVDSDGIRGGTDIETDIAYRERILARKRRPPHGGTELDYKNWVLEVSGVTRAWILPLLYGPGTVGVAFVRDDDTPIFPTSGEVEDVEDYLISHTDANGDTVGIPVTAQLGLFVYAPAAYPVNFDIDIYPNTAEVQAAVQAELEDLILREAGVQSTLYLSRINEAISAAVGENRHQLNSPISDVTITYIQLHTLGTITFGSY